MSALVEGLHDGAGVGDGRVRQRQETAALLYRVGVQRERAAALEQQHGRREVRVRGGQHGAGALELNGGTRLEQAETEEAWARSCSPPPATATVWFARISSVPRLASTFADTLQWRQQSAVSAATDTSASTDTCCAASSRRAIPALCVPEIARAVRVPSGVDSCRSPHWICCSSEPSRLRVVEASEAAAAPPTVIEREDGHEPTRSGSLPRERGQERPRPLP